MRIESLRIAGEKVGADRSGERVIAVHNPYTRERVGTVPKATMDVVRRAFDIAKNYKSRLSRFERSNILNKAAALVRERSAAMACTRSEVPRAMCWTPGPR